MKVPSEDGRRISSVWRMGRGGSSHDMHADRNRERKREDEKDKRVSVPSVPAWALTISPARTQRCSWVPRGTSWCLPSYPGAPTRFCEKAGVIEWVWCGMEESQSLSNSLHGNLRGLRHFFQCKNVCPHYPCSLSVSCSHSLPPPTL